MKNYQYIDNTLANPIEAKVSKEGVDVDSSGKTARCQEEIFKSGMFQELPTMP